MSVLRHRTYVQQDPSSCRAARPHTAVYAEPVTRVTSLEVCPASQNKCLDRISPPWHDDRMTDTHCPDGATNAEHDTMLEMTGHCPWCGEEDGTTISPPDLDESIARLIIRANRTGPQGIGTPFRSTLTGICNALLAIRHELRREVI